ncbi:hypothetical protein [Amycolatopsis viridis]|uniref:Uncharacterized protein n=1 Tax=Amycolatopsis viridis TaxID=185678 RepID=A0ABX0SW61_9PSEU|nr:hypothetical protein [Amycolatopsis viridis]NIH79595.1 hypothetical protein [Amycolatopsis viridis]
MLLIERPVRLHRPLMVVTVAMTVLAAVAVVGLFTDPRELVGGPIWSKAAKFAVSIAVYTATLAGMLSLLPKARRWGWWMGTVVAACLVVEMALIIGQTIVRGRRLHFNFATASDRFIHNQMATAIYLLWAATLVVAVLLSCQRLPDRPQATAVRAGLFLALTGMALGMLMFAPTPEQRAVLDAGGKPAVVGSHSIGAPEDGPGLPLTGWSTAGGDLRIAHFAGLHALQLLPLLAFGLAALSRRVPVLRPPLVRRRLIRIAALEYLGLIAVLTWQALRGQPLLRPDGATLLAVGALVVTAVGAGALALRRSPGRPQPSQ